MTKKLLHHSIGACARVYVHLLWWVWHALNRVLSISACVGVYDTQVSVDTSVHTREHIIHRVCTCARVCAVCLFALGNDSGGFQLVHTGHLLLAWGVICDIRKIGVLSVYLQFFFDWGVSIYGFIFEFTYIHTPSYLGYSDVSPGVGTSLRHLKNPKNPAGLYLGIPVHVFVYVYKVHMCICMLEGGMRSSSGPRIVSVCRLSLSLSHQI